MTTSKTSPLEWVSHLHDDALAEWPDHLELDDEVVAHWRLLVTTRQALQGEAVAEAASTHRLLAGMRSAYAASAPASAAQHEPAPEAPSPARPSLDTQRPAANQATWAWPWAAALVLMVGGWMAWPSADAPPTVVAQNTVTPRQAAPVVGPDGVIRDPKLDALLQSHRQWGAASALQYPAGLVRNVALER